MGGCQWRSQFGLRLQTSGTKHDLSSGPCSNSSGKSERSAGGNRTSFAFLTIPTFPDYLLCPEGNRTHRSIGVFQRQKHDALEAFDEIGFKVTNGFESSRQG